MGMFDQLRAASNMMKNMSPEDLKELMRQAEESKKLMEETIKKGVESEIQRRGLISRAEVEEMIRQAKS